MDTLLLELIRGDAIANADSGWATQDVISTVLILMDAKMMTEAATQPRATAAPIPLDKNRSIGTSVLSARYRADSPEAAYLNEGEAVVVFDAYRSNMKRLLQPWLGPLDLSSDPRTPSKNGADEIDTGDEPLVADADAQSAQSTGDIVRHSKITVFVIESSLRARRKLTRGPMSLPQAEICHGMGRGLALPFIESHVFAGQSNWGISSGPIELETELVGWRETVAKKRGLYGQFRVKVGGRGSEAKRSRKDADAEPVFRISYLGECHAT